MDELEATSYEYFLALRLHEIRRRSSDAAARTPAQYNGHFMALNTTDADSPAPLTAYDADEDSPLVATTHPACVAAGGYLVLIGGKDTNGKLISTTQYVAG